MPFQIVGTPAVQVTRLGLDQVGEPPRAEIRPRQHLPAPTMAAT